MPFEATVAGDVFQCKLDQCFGKIKQVIVIADDTMIVIYCKIKVKQALYKHKCDKVPLIVLICIESLTTKLVHSVYHSNIGVYSE